jgi:hypothetical protein
MDFRIETNKEQRARNKEQGARSKEQGARNKDLFWGIKLLLRIK